MKALSRRAMLVGGPAIAPVCLVEASPPRTPVLVELFTSEGCSSCPPADVLLRTLQEQQPIAGVELITLGEHVDYWDYIGWKDVNAHSRFTQRQQTYARHFSKEGPYTPQMVVDGSFAFVGSDSRAFTRAVALATKERKWPLQLRWEEGMLRIEMPADSPGLRHEAEVVVALTRNSVQTEVRRGENAGRQLHHASVVTHWLALGRPSPMMETKLSEAVLLAGDVVAVFVQQTRSRKVVSVAQQRLR